MNLKDRLKKVYNSFDFRGNRIKNLRVDSPSEDPDYREEGYAEKKDFVANKAYVDKVTTYDTETAHKYNYPFLLQWFKEQKIDVYGLPYKELWDNLLFPRIKPTYISPELKRIKFTVIDQVLWKADNGAHVNTKYILFFGQTANINIDVKVDKGDWEASHNASFVVVDKDGTEKYTTTTKETASSKMKFEASFKPEPGYKYLIKQTYDTCPPKKDTWGDDSPVDPAKYDFEVDVTSMFEKQCYFSYPILYKLLDDKGAPAIENEDYVIDNVIQTNADNECIMELQVPEVMYKLPVTDVKVELKYMILRDGVVTGTGWINELDVLDDLESSLEGVYVEPEDVKSPFEDEYAGMPEEEGNEGDSSDLSDAESEISQVNEIEAAVEEGPVGTLEDPIVHEASIIGLEYECQYRTIKPINFGTFEHSEKIYLYPDVVVNPSIKNRR